MVTFETDFDKKMINEINSNSNVIPYIEYKDGTQYFYNLREGYETTLNKETIYKILKCFFGNGFVGTRPMVYNEDIMIKQGIQFAIDYIDEEDYEFFEKHKPTLKNVQTFFKKMVKYSDYGNIFELNEGILYFVDLNCGLFIDNNKECYLIDTSNISVVPKE